MFFSHFDNFLSFCLQLKKIFSFLKSSKSFFSLNLVEDSVNSSIFHQKTTFTSIETHIQYQLCGSSNSLSKLKWFLTPHPRHANKTLTRTQFTMNYDAQTSWLSKVNILGRLEKRVKVFQITLFFCFSPVSFLVGRWGIKIIWAKYSNRLTIFTKDAPKYSTPIDIFHSFLEIHISVEVRYNQNFLMSCQSRLKNIYFFLLFGLFEKTFLVLYKFFASNSNQSWRIRIKSRIQIKSFSIPFTEWSLTTSTTSTSH